MGYDGSDAACLTLTVNLHSGYQGEGSLAGSTDAMRYGLDLTLLSVQWRIDILLRILRLSVISAWLVRARKEMEHETPECLLTP